MPDFRQLGSTSPEWLIAREDSLLTEFPGNEHLLQALTAVHLEKANKAYIQEDWKSAVDHYGRILSLEPRNSSGRFGLAMAEGRGFFKKGGPNDLWEAIVKFGEAAVIDTASGLPQIWLARSYEKKDENDFDLIVESYDLALRKILSEADRLEAIEERKIVLHRKEIFEAFWN